MLEKSRARRILSLLVAALAVPAVVFAQAGPDQGREALRTLFEDGPEELTYTEQFGNAASPSELQNLVDQIENQLGSFIEVQGDGNPYTLAFANGEATVQMVLNTDGEVAGLQFTQLVPRTASLDEAVGALLERPGETSITIRENGEALLSRGVREPLAVGSAFKLAVLKAVEDAVASSRTSWDSVIELTEDDKSLPSGVMQSWPTGTSVTVEAASILMMSQSDNTATDLLVRHVGKRAVEQYAPSSRPLLTTREFFVLKADDQEQVRERYLGGSESGRRTILANLDGELPPPSLFSGDPVHPRIEWFFTTEQLAGLIERIDRMDILAVNPGPIDTEDWQEYGYKGGSEPGVINMTLRLVSTSGDTYALSATQSRSDDTVDTSAFVSALQAVLTHLK